MTARVQTHEVALYREMGAADVIAKPFDPMALSDTVRSSGAPSLPEGNRWIRASPGTSGSTSPAASPTASARSRTPGASPGVRLGCGARPALHRLAHSLTGTGATFGFPAASEAARKLEVFSRARSRARASAGAAPGRGLLGELRQTAEPSSPLPSEKRRGGALPVGLGLERLLFLVEDDPELARRSPTSSSTSGTGCGSSTASTACRRGREGPSGALIMDACSPRAGWPGRSGSGRCGTRTARP